MNGHADRCITSNWAGIKTGAVSEDETHRRRAPTRQIQHQWAVKPVARSPMPPSGVWGPAMDAILTGTIRRVL